MRIVSGVPKHTLWLVKHSPPDLSSDAKRRLKWFEWNREHGGNVSRTCRHFDISRQTFYRWKRRYDPHHLETLEDRPSRPKRRRQRTWTTDQVIAVQEMRERYPRWGKAKLQRLLAQEGVRLSVSMVGRILKYLKRRGVLHEPPVRGISARKRLWRRPYAIRKPKDYAVEAPGDLVEIDTLDVRPLPGAVLKQFTAHDVISRWDVLDIHERATSNTATEALDAVLARMPFPIKAIQIDGGSEFMGEFEQACRDRGLQLFVLPPRSPKLNGSVERANRTHAEEFYECTPVLSTVARLAPELLGWEKVYNTVRPHQALGYLTPAQFWDAYQADPTAALAALSQNRRKGEVSRR